MQATLVVHIIAGSLGLAAGYIALYVTKGAALHRRAGIVFVCAMLTMSFAGITMAVVRGVAPEINVPAGLTTAYLTVTALTTVRPRSDRPQWVDPAAMTLGAVIGLVAFGVGVALLAGGGPERGFAYPLFMFGTVALIGASGDYRVMRSGELRGRQRLARHLWRMCFALFIAAMSFFIGQAKVFPESMRIMPLLAIPPFAVLGTMIYWLRRVRVRAVPGVHERKARSQSSLSQRTT